jgi:hypothetical protein
MRLATPFLMLATAAIAAPASAQVRLSDPWKAEAPPRTVAEVMTRLDRQERGLYLASRVDFAEADRAVRDPSALTAVNRTEARFEGGGFDDRLSLRQTGRLRRADGAPVPPGPRDAAMLDAETYDVIYTRGWTGDLGQTASGLDVHLTPHVGVGVGNRGGLTEAGATIKVGRDLDRLVPDGGEAFGERTRWYIYAAGSGRAVGYNFARDRDGQYARSGMSHDSGAFLGDASVGVALRRGPVHGSFGVIYREIEAKGLRAGHGVDTDVSEGVVAFQLSIKPE